MKNLRTMVLWIAIPVFGVCLLKVPPALAAGSDTEGLYKGKCTVCHGADGSGSTPMGKAMKIPDLRSAEVQKRSDAELAEIISNGKNKMPPFKGKLTEEQVHQLVTYIREMAKK